MDEYNWDKYHCTSYTSLYPSLLPLLAWTYMDAESFACIYDMHADVPLEVWLFISRTEFQSPKFYYCCPHTGTEGRTCHKRSQACNAGLSPLGIQWHFETWNIFWLVTLSGVMSMPLKGSQPLAQTKSPTEWITNRKCIDCCSQIWWHMPYQKGSAPPSMLR